MKNASFTSILRSSFLTCGLAFGAFASAASASAQTGTTMVQVNIPFAFQAGSQQLPAGKYQISRETAHIIELRSTGKAAIFVMTNSAVKLHPADHGSVVFGHYGNKYFLRQIWTAGNSDGVECPKSRAEKEALLAMTKQDGTPTELALNTEPLR